MNLNAAMNKKTIAVIGTGRMGKALSRVFSSSFASVIISSRSEQKARQLITELNMPSLHYLPTKEAIDKADIIIVTLWYTDELNFIQQYKEELKGKIYFNISVPFNQLFTDLILPYGRSAAEIVQGFLPETKVVGIFKTIFWPVFDEVLQNGGGHDVYITAEDPLLARELMELLKPLPFRFLYAGTLAENKTIERMTLLARKTGINAGLYPRIAFSLFR